MGLRGLSSFIFPLRKFDDSHALFSNFKYLEMYLRTLSIGDSATAQVILAADDSTDRAKGRADLVCDAVNDEDTILDAINLLDSDLGGTIVFLNGTYVFHDQLVIPTVNALALRGEGKARLLCTTSVPTPQDDADRFIIELAACENSFEVSGFIFDGGEVSSSSFIENATQTAKPDIWIHDNIFESYKGRIFQTERGSGEAVFITNNVFRDCTNLRADNHAPNFAMISANRNTPHRFFVIADNVFFNLTFIDFLDPVHIINTNADGVGLITGNIVKDCSGFPTDFFLTDNRVAIYHNWINGYVAGDHTGLDHGTLSGLTDDDHTQYVLETLADAKGDLWVASAADTAARLAAGADYKKLIALAAETTGLKWVFDDRALSVNTTVVGNIGTGEDDLMSYTVPASTLATNGDALVFEATGRFAATVNNKRIRVKYGATTLFDTGALAVTAAGDWSLEGEVIRVDATNQKAVVRFQSSDAVMLANVDYTTPAETLSGTVVFKLTAEATADNDIVQEMMRVRHEPAPQ